MSQPRRALILSAGRGERLRPITDDRPKTMVRVGGHPILEYHVAFLRDLGIQDLAINLHYLPDVIRAHFGDGSDWGVRIRYSVEETLLGTAGAAKRLEEFLGTGTFLVVYGDNLFDFDLRPLLACHRKARAIATIGVYEGEDPTAGGIVEMVPTGRVTRFVEKPRPEEVFSRLVSAGIYVMEPRVLSFIPEGRPRDFGREVLPSLIAADLPVYGKRLSGTLYGIDTPERLQRTEAAVAAAGLPAPRRSVSAET